MKHYINVRYLCHKAGKQSNIFENENRHSWAEVTEGLSKSWRGFGSQRCLYFPRMLILERPVAPGMRQCVVSGLSASFQSTRTGVELRATEFPTAWFSESTISKCQVSRKRSSVHSND